MFIFLFSLVLFHLKTWFYGQTPVKTEPTSLLKMSKPTLETKNVSTRSSQSDFLTCRSDDRNTDRKLLLEVNKKKSMSKI